MATCDHMTAHCVNGLVRVVDVIEADRHVQQRASWLTATSVRIKIHVTNWFDQTETCNGGSSLLFQAFLHSFARGDPKKLLRSLGEQHFTPGASFAAFFGQYASNMSRNVLDNASTCWSTNRETECLRGNLLLLLLRIIKNTTSKEEGKLREMATRYRYK